jgi:T5orf172 domain
LREYIYVLTNPSIPNLVKVGFSSKDPFMRAKELNGTHLPTSFVVEYYLFIDDNAQQIEQYTHRLMKTNGFWQQPDSAGVGGEFFKCDVADAVVYIRRARDYFRQNTIEERFIREENLKAIAEKQRKIEEEKRKIEFEEKHRIEQEQKRQYELRQKKIEYDYYQKCLQSKLAEESVQKELELEQEKITQHENIRKLENQRQLEAKQARMEEIISSRSKEAQRLLGIQFKSLVSRLREHHEPFSNFFVMFVTAIFWIPCGIFLSAAFLFFLADYLYISKNAIELCSIILTIIFTIVFIKKAKASNIVKNQKLELSYKQKWSELNSQFEQACLRAETGKIVVCSSCFEEFSIADVYSVGLIKCPDCGNTVSC